MERLRNFKFEVEVEGEGTIGGFSKISGLKASTEVIEYRDGGDPETPEKYPGQTKYDNVTLERGTFTEAGGDFVRRMRALVADSKARGDLGATGGDNEAYKKKYTIYVKNKAGKRVKCIVLEKAWPPDEEYDDLDANANDIWKERLVLAHSRMKVFDSGSPTA